MLFDDRFGDGEPETGPAMEPRIRSIEQSELR
jgi:hypothetical protein